MSTDAKREQFKSFLTKKGLRVTNQRLAIFEAAFAQKEHFTAEGLLDHAR
ncbi:MAG: transcriptional repressor, partial [Opitutaceae bacterium]|nr:transcriptional repressor [Opitutaceae bacterium]